MIDRIGEWYSIREQYQQEGGVTYPSRADVEHSALLHRLLSGHKALEYPPPRSFSYPNYRAAEGREFRPMSVFFTETHLGRPIDIGTLLEGEDVPGHVVIDQASWEVLSREGGMFFIKWRTDPATWTLRYEGERHTTIINEDTHMWILLRMQDDTGDFYADEMGL